MVSSAGTTTLTYDFEGRATSIVGPGISQTNVYNGLDTRVSKVENSVGTTFLRTGANVVAPVVRDTNAVYTPGISEVRGGTTKFLHSGLKNADAQSSTSQTVSATRVYDAFGNVASSTGTWSGPFGYAGGFGYQEDATGLKLLGHRLYDSSTGRFITRDPIKDGRNWYVYCGNDPLGCADDSGNSAKWIVKIFEKRGNDIVEIIYHIIPGIGKRPAKSYAKSLDGVKDIRWDNGHKGGPPHYHNEAKPEIHITSEGYADEATTPPWNHWRDIGKFIGGFIDPTPISAAIEGGEEAGRQIDPWVKEMQQRRSRAASWWMEE